MDQKIQMNIPSLQAELQSGGGGRGRGDGEKSTETYALFMHNILTSMIIISLLLSNTILIT